MPDIVRQAFLVPVLQLEETNRRLETGQEEEEEVDVCRMMDTHEEEEVAPELTAPPAAAAPRLESVDSPADSNALPSLSRE